MKILETVEELTRLLDVPEPWEIQVIDPSGVSEVSPADSVSQERYDPDAEEDATVHQDTAAETGAQADAADLRT